MDVLKDCINRDFCYRDGSLYWSIKPSSKVNKGDKAGYLCEKGYIKVTYNNKEYYLHRLIYIMFNGVNFDFVDHIDGDKLNNKIENLRGCTHSQNMMNAKISKRNSTGVKGVSYNKKSKSYVARVMIDRVSHYLGSYKTLEEAKKVVIKSRDFLHKDFARHS